MKVFLKKAGVVALVCGVGLLIQCGYLYALGARINTTRSIPLGLYWQVNAPVEKGAFVILCPPPNALFMEARARGYIGVGSCPGNFGRLMKRIVAAPGDVVRVAADGVYVNGLRLPHSVPMTMDGGGRPLWRYAQSPQALGATQLMLMGDINPKSFDGRYFGPLQRAQIQGVIAPILTWDGAADDSQGGKQ